MISSTGTMAVITVKGIFRIAINPNVHTTLRPAVRNGIITPPNDLRVRARVANSTRTASGSTLSWSRWIFSRISVRT